MSKESSLFQGPGFSWVEESLMLQLIYRLFRLFLLSFCTLFGVCPPFDPFSVFSSSRSFCCTVFLLFPSFDVWGRFIQCTTGNIPCWVNMVGTCTLGTSIQGSYLTCTYLTAGRCNGVATRGCQGANRGCQGAATRGCHGCGATCSAG